MEDFTEDEQYWLGQVTLKEEPFKSRLRVWFWNENLFSNGKRYFHLKVPQKRGVPPMCVHNTWIRGHDTKVRPRGKRARVLFPCFPCVRLTS